MSNVDIVIVTFNRLQKLTHTLECYDKQTMPFRNIIVVNNHSTDGTYEFLNDWKEIKSAYGKHVIHLDRNTGGSGGFYEGQKYALTLEPDWVYISDDDAYPAENMMEEFYKAEADCNGLKMAAICSIVYYPDYSINVSTRGRYSIQDKLYNLVYAEENEYKLPFFEINTLSYVGAFISANALREVGLVNPDFFIYQDDCEHSIRLSKYGKMRCYPKISVLHDEPRQQSAEAIQKGLWKEYYSSRNNLFMLLTHFPECKKQHIAYWLNKINAHKDISLAPIQKMYLEGIKDALLGRLGMHPVYRPGLVPDGSTCLPYPKWSWKIFYWIRRVVRMLKK